MLGLHKLLRSHLRWHPPHHHHPHHGHRLQQQQQRQQHSLRMVWMTHSMMHSSVAPAAAALTRQVPSLIIMGHGGAGFRQGYHQQFQQGRRYSSLPPLLLQGRRPLQNGGTLHPCPSYENKITLSGSRLLFHSTSQQQDMTAPPSPTLESELHQVKETKILDAAQTTFLQVLVNAAGEDPHWYKNETKLQTVEAAVEHGMSRQQQQDADTAVSEGQDSSTSMTTPSNQTALGRWQSATNQADGQLDFQKVMSEVEECLDQVAPKTSSVHSDKSAQDFYFKLSVDFQEEVLPCQFGAFTRENATTELKRAQEEIQGKAIWSIDVKWGRKGAILNSNDDIPKIRRAFGLRPMTLKHLQELSETSLSPLEKTVVGMELKPEPAYVTADSGDNAFQSYSADDQVDKSYAIVVAGESGSGKSVHACLKARQYADVTAYCPVTESILVSLPKPSMSEYGLLREELDRLLVIWVDDKDEENYKFDWVYAVKRELHQERNSWAEKVFEECLAVFAPYDLSRWMSATWPKTELPQKLAIIIDEATDMDLAEGLVAVVRRLKTRYSRLAQQDVMIIIAGTGLDVIKGQGCVGTNPKHSKLVTMKTPNLKKVKAAMTSEPNMHQLRQEQWEAIFKAIERGVFSRVLMSNARMFFQSVLPIMLQDNHRTDGKMDDKVEVSRLEERLALIASFGPIMDHGPRSYVNQNRIGDMSENSRGALLKQAFLFHTMRSIEDGQQREEGSLQTNAERELNYIQKCIRELRQDLSKEDGEETDVEDLISEEIFRRGLATRTTTSNALKYLSCFGLSCAVRSAFGTELEEMVALHYMRLMQVEGFEAKRVTLKHAWPPQRHNGSLWKQIVNLPDKLDEQFETETRDLQRDPAIDKSCLVFSQGTATAQGGDVLALVMEGKKGRIDTIQCKNISKKTYAPGKVREEWWPRLGVFVSKKIDCDLYPQRGKDKTWADQSPEMANAHYSLLGLEKLAELCKERCSLDEVTIGQRIIATSLAINQTTSNFPIPDNTNLRVWFREMLEPTISVLVPNDPMERKESHESEQKEGDED